MKRVQFVRGLRASHARERAHGKAIDTCHHARPSGEAARRSWPPHREHRRGRAGRTLAQRDGSPGRGSQLERGELSEPLHLRRPLGGELHQHQLLRGGWRVRKLWHRANLRRAMERQLDVPGHRGTRRRIHGNRAQRHQLCLDKLLRCGRSLLQGGRGSHDPGQVERHCAGLDAGAPHLRAGRHRRPHGVSCKGTTFCMAVGYYTDEPTYPFSLEWNGSAWSQQTVPAPSSTTDMQLSGAAAPAPASAWRWASNTYSAPRAT